MADKPPYHIDLIQTLGGDKPTDIQWQLDEGFVRRQEAQERDDWNAALSGGPGGEQAGATTAEGPPPQPSAIVEGAKATGNAFVDGMTLAHEGIKELGPKTFGEPAQEPKGTIPALKKVFDGLMGMGLSPFVGLGTAGGQALENYDPGLAGQEFASGQEALNYRAFLSMKAQADLTPEERQAMSRPMSVREALETAIQIGAPLAVGPATKGAKKIAPKAAEALKSERGSVGVPPPEGAPIEPRANMARVGAEGAVRDLIKELDVEAQKAGLIHKEVISRVETAAGAKAKDMTIERALKLDYNALHENATALRDLRDHAFTQMEALRIEALGGDPKAVARAENAAVIAALLEHKAVEVGTDIGRGLGSFNIISDAARAYEGADIVKIVDQWKAGMLPGDSLVARLTQLRQKQQRKVFLKQLLDGYNRGQNVFYEAWINGLLSNPLSHVANVAGNAMVAAWGIAERQQAGLFNVILTRDPEGVRIGEAAIMLRAAVTAQKQSTLVAWKVLRDGKSVFGGDKMEVAPSLTAERMGLSPENPLAGAVDFTGSGIRLPSRLMMSEDAYFKWLNYRMDIEARAWREAGMRGLRGDAKGEFIRDFVANTPPEARAASEHFAMMQTFNQRFAGEQSLAARAGQIGQGIQRFPMGRLLFPFMVVPVRVSEYAWQRTPGLSLIGEALYRDIGKKGAARDLALARLGTSAMMAAAYMEFSAAGLVTGAGVEKGDAKDALKQLGRQDYAVRVGEDLYRIQRLSPPGMMIGALASYAEIAGQLPEQARVELGVALAMVMAEAIKDQPFFQQMNHVMQAVQNPGSMTKNFIESNVRTLIPFSGLVHQVKKSGIPGVLEPDPYKRVTTALTEWEQLKNMYIADLPNYSKTLPSLKNQITGDPIVLPPGFGLDMVSPITVTHLHNDIVFEEIARNRPSLPEFPKALPGKVPPALQMDAQKAVTDQSIPLTAEEIDRGITIQTKEIQVDGRNLYQHLRYLVEQPEYQALTPGLGGGRKWELEKVYGKFRDQAILKFRSENQDLDQAVRTLLEQKMIRKRGQAEGQPPPVQIAPGMVLPGAR